MLGILWDADAALTAGEVAEHIDDQLAYTTVMTILARRWKKGLWSANAPGAPTPTGP